MVVLELEVKNSELENIQDFLDVVSGPSSEIKSGTSTEPQTFKIQLTVMTLKPHHIFLYCHQDTRIQTHSLLIVFWVVGLIRSPWGITWNFIKMNILYSSTFNYFKINFSATKLNFEKPPAGGGARGWIQNSPESARLRFQFYFFPWWVSFNKYMCSS